MKLERTPTGKIELRIANDTDEFVRLAEFVREKLKGRWKEQIDGPDQSYWDLDVRGSVLTVHREHYLGVSVLCDDHPASRLLLEQLRSEIEADNTE